MPPRIRPARSAAIAALLFAAAALPAAADGRNADPADGVIVGAMLEGAETEGPPAHAAFCARSPEDCAPSDAPMPGAYATLTRSTRAELEEFNEGVNDAFHPIDDGAFYGVSDYWTLPEIGADCEDYVLYKRARLIEAGWPPESALIAVVKSPRDGYHAVLILRTSEGELVLDNLRDEVLDWRDTGYEWVIRQSTRDPRLWVTIVAPEDGLTS